MPVKAWYYNPNSEEDPDEKDPTLPHHYKPERQVPQELLNSTVHLIASISPPRSLISNLIDVRFCVHFIPNCS